MTGKIMKSPVNFFMNPGIKQVQIAIEGLLKQSSGSWGVVVEDVKTGERFAWNDQRVFYAASLIKVPIMVAVYAEAWAGTLSLEDRLTLTKEVQVGGSGVLQHLSPGLKISIRDLVMLMIIQSDNTATNILIDRVGREQIQKILLELGMKESQFYNKLMVVPAKLDGYNRVTAADMAACYRMLAQGKAVSYHHSMEMIEILKRQQIKTSFPSLLPASNTSIVGCIPDWQLAHKTGRVENILHDSGIFYIRDRAIILVALSEGCKQDQSNAIMGKMAKRIYDLYQGEEGKRSE